jgi:hypothetical protein
VEVVEALLLQLGAHLGGHRAGDQATGLGILVQAVEQVGQPAGNRSLAGGRHLLQAVEVGHRHDARHDRNGDPRGARLVDEAQEGVDVEEELTDAQGRAGVDLGLQHIDVVVQRRALGMLLGIDADQHLERGDAAQRRRQLGRVLVAVLARHVDAADAALARRRVAAQRHDVAHADVPVVVDHLVDLGAAGADAGQVRGRLQRGLVEDPLDGAVGALAGRAPGAVGHRDEGRVQRGQTGDRLPQALFHLLGLRRKELERHARTDGAGGALAGAGHRTDHATGGRQGHAAVLSARAGRSRS